MMDGTALSEKNNLGGRNLMVARNVAESFLVVRNLNYEHQRTYSVSILIIPLTLTNTQLLGPMPCEVDDR